MPAFREILDIFLISSKLRHQHTQYHGLSANTLALCWPSVKPALRIMVQHGADVLCWLGYGSMWNLILFKYLIVHF